MNKNYYILVNSDVSEFIRKQQRFNRKTALLSVFSIIYVTVLTCAVNKQQEKIRQLAEDRES